MAFNTSFSGFTSKEDATKFFAKLKSNPEVESAEVTNSSANGDADLKLVMKDFHDKTYYVGLAQKLGVSYIVVNDQKKTPAQIIEDIRNNNK